MIWESVAGERFKKYGEFTLVDSLCKQYNYTHDQVFKLSWTEAMTFIAYNREYSYVDFKTRETQRKMNKK